MRSYPHAMPIANQRILRTALLFILFSHSPLSHAAIPLTEAIKNKLVAVTITGIDYRTDSIYHSSFYGKCLLMKCRNLKATPIELTEAAGRFFMPDDTGIQRMVLTAALNIKVPANKEITIPMFAMCTEANDGAPSDRRSFSLGAIAPKNLLTLIQFIDQHHYQNEAAQQAIWCITNHYSPGDIYSDDTIMTQQLQKLVCSVTGIPYVKGDFKREVVPLMRMVDGAFTYSIERPKTVDLVIYNEAGQVVKNVVAHEFQEAGTRTYAYHFTLPINDDALLKQSLLIKFYLNGQLIVQKKHVLASH